MIRQAISCDVCGTEKRQTNHWFIAHEQGDELRVSGWNSRNRLRPGFKHLCGQTCLHKLLDEFVARTLGTRGPAAAEAAMPDDTSTEDALSTEKLSQQPFAATRRQPPVPPIVPLPRRIPPAAKPAPTTIPNRIPFQLPPADLPQPSDLQPPESFILPMDAPSSGSRDRRAEAWKRERERDARSEKPARRGLMG